MRLPKFLQTTHERITEWIAKRWLVEHVLIATIEEPNGEKYDCIYCTIARCAVFFSLAGLGLGYVLWA